jgi:cellulose synthase/poly-beta-1,6-N-acetylglucosamine synthase-like glycosyltransferase
MKPVDIFITAYLRPQLTEQTLAYLKERTTYPHRVFLIDNGGNEMLKDQVDYYIGMSKNIGIHAAWNIALAMAESEYFITSDNDIYVPDLQPDWLTQMVKFMFDRPDYGAISLHPHVFIGAAGIDPQDPEDVKERNMCGAVMRIMRTQAVRNVGGWLHHLNPGRNHEERTICSELQTAGYKVGITSRIRAYHPFPNNWGYPEEFTPEMQKHNPDLKDYVVGFDQPDAYDSKTYLPK